MSKKIEKLSSSISVEVSHDHTFGEDALLLAEFSANSFAKPTDGKKACEFGCGCGIISLIWCRDGHPASIDAVELQQEAAAMADRSVQRSGLSHIIRVHHDDLRQIGMVLKNGSMDVVAMNPPYFPAGSGKVSDTAASVLARHEGAGCTMKEYCAAAGALLHDGGSFYICHKPERLCDLMSCLRAARLEPKLIHYILLPGARRPRLMLIKAKKNARAGIITEIIERGSPSWQAL